MTPPPRTSTFTIIRSRCHRPPLPQATQLRQNSSRPLQRVAEYRHDVVDVAALDDQRWRHRESIAGITQHETAVEAVHHDLVAPAADRIRPRRELDACDQADGTDVDH